MSKIEKVAELVKELAQTMEQISEEVGHFGGADWFVDEYPFIIEFDELIELVHDWRVGMLEFSEMIKKKEEGTK